MEPRRDQGRKDVERKKTKEEGNKKEKGQGSTQREVSRSFLLVKQPIKTFFPCVFQVPIIEKHVLPSYSSSLNTAK